MNQAGALSYAVAAAAFVALAAVQFVGWRGRAPGGRLILATCMSVAWAVVLAVEYTRRDELTVQTEPIEWLRSAAWLFALAGLVQSMGVVRPLVRAAYVLCGASVLVAATIAVFGDLGASRMLLMGGLVLPTAGVVLLEQMFRNSDLAGRRALKPLFIGLGGILVFDVFMFGESMIAASASSEALVARGFINAACVPAIALAARRNPEWSLDVFVSRHVVFYSTASLAVGLYLVAMATGGYLIALTGGHWGDAAQLVFFACAGVLLATLVSSESLRGRLRVFLSKHFYRNKYDYRTEWLRFVSSLEAGSARGEPQQAMIEAIAQIVGSRFGTLWVRTEDERRLVMASQWAQTGSRSRVFAAIECSSEFVGFLEQRQWIVDLDEHGRASDVYDNVRLPDSLAATHDLTLFVPLMQGGRLVGLVGVGKPDQPFEITFEDRDLLKTVGRHLGTHIAQLEADRRLSESRQFEAYSRLTAFMMHDLKNLVAQLSLVVSNAERHRRNPDFVDDVIDTIQNSTDRISRLIDQLGRGEVRSVEREVPLRGLLERIVARSADRLPVPQFESAVDDVVVMADPERLMSTLEHVLRNSHEATPADGAITVRLARDGDRAVIQIADSGVGMTAEFIRDRLFRPFDSTKGSKGMGIGAYQVRDYVRGLRGDVAVSSSPGGGTVFSIYVPVGAPGAGG